LAAGPAGELAAGSRERAPKEKGVVRERDKWKG